MPPLVCDPVMTDEVVSYMKELPIPGLTPVLDTSASASEDFATIAGKDSTYQIRFRSPHSHIPSRIGIKDFPRSVRLYSTLGGIVSDIFFHFVKEDNSKFH